MNDLFESSTNKSSKFAIIGKILAGIIGTATVAVTVITIPFISPALRKHCLPYVPATDTQIRNVIRALKNRQGSVIDLGSGDGRIVLEIAKHQFESHGVELNPWLVVYAKICSKLQKGTNSKTRFFRKDLWKFNLSPYQNVVVFGVEQMMNDLEMKILKECHNNSEVITCRFPYQTYNHIELLVKASILCGYID